MGQRASESSSKHQSWTGTKACLYDSNNTDSRHKLQQKLTVGPLRLREQGDMISSQTCLMLLALRALAALKKLGLECLLETCCQA